MIKSRRIRWTRHVACMGVKINGRHTLRRRPEKLLEKSKRRREDNINMYLKGWEDMDWIHQAVNREH
jgi:hypothetical protein